MITRYQLAQYVGQQVKKLRYERNLTQVELSKKSGVSQNFISNIENGTVSVDYYHLFLLSMTLDVGMGYFSPYKNTLWEGENEGDRGSSRPNEQAEL